LMFLAQFNSRLDKGVDVRRCWVTGLILFKKSMELSSMLEEASCSSWRRYKRRSFRSLFLLYTIRCAVLCTKNRDNNNRCLLDFVNEKLPNLDIMFPKPLGKSSSTVIFTSIITMSAFSRFQRPGLACHGYINAVCALLPFYLHSLPRNYLH
jgi:hypothetical protein